MLNLAGMAASFLLGNLRDVFQGRVGLAIVLGGAAIVVYNDPTHAAGELFFTPGLFADRLARGGAARAAAQADAADSALPTPSADARRTLAAP